MPPAMMVGLALVAGLLALASAGTKSLGPKFNGDGFYYSKNDTSLKLCMADAKGSCAHCTAFDGSDRSTCGGEEVMHCYGGCDNDCYPANNLRKTFCDKDEKCPFTYAPGQTCSAQCSAAGPGKPCHLPTTMGEHSPECCSRAGCGWNPACSAPTCSDHPKDPTCKCTCGCGATDCDCGAPACYAPSTFRWGEGSWQREVEPVQ